MKFTKKSKKNTKKDLTKSEKFIIILIERVSESLRILKTKQENKMRYKQKNYKNYKNEFTAEQKKAYAEMKRREREERIANDNSITLEFEEKFEDYRWNKTYRNYIECKFEYRADKVEAVKSLNKNERVASYNGEYKFWIIDFEKVDADTLREAFKDYEINFIFPTCFDKETIDFYHANKDKIASLLDLNENKEYKDAIVSLYKNTK